MDLQSLVTQLQEAHKLHEELRASIAALRSDYDALLDATNKVVEERDGQRKRIEELEAVNKRLTDMLWGRRSEKRSVSPGQGLLPFSDALPEAAPGEDPSTIAAPADPLEAIDAELIRQWERRRRQRRRQPRNEEFPAHLERRERILDLRDDEKVGLKYIGDAITERMHFERPHVYIERIVRRKYVVDGQPDKGVKAPPPPLAIVEGCKYDFSLIAAILALKYAFHLPTYRQQDWFAQSGWFPRRSTINELLNVSVETVQPLVAQQWRMLQRQSVLLADETRVLVLTHDSLTTEQQEQLRRRKRSRNAEDDALGETTEVGSATSYAWLVMGLDGLAPYNQFHWTLTRQPTAIDSWLEPFQGIVVGDAYDAYARVEQRMQGRIQHASCNVHARREFTQSESYEPVLCGQIGSLYGQLYEIEERGKLLSVDARLELRQREAVPIWRRMEAWLQSDAVLRAALPRSPFGKAVGYLKNQWNALQRYLSNGYVPIDNDQAEQTIRPLAVGRKNWLFLGHPAAAIGRMQLLSVVSSAHRHNLIVEDYLTDVLTKLADARQNHPHYLEPDSSYLLDLLPDRWAAAHPASIRQGRVLEKQSVSDDKRARRAMRRQRARRAQRGTK